MNSTRAGLKVFLGALTAGAVAAGVVVAVVVVLGSGLGSDDMAGGFVLIALFTAGMLTIVPLCALGEVVALLVSLRRVRELPIKSVVIVSALAPTPSLLAAVPLLTGRLGEIWTPIAAVGTVILMLSLVTGAGLRVAAGRRRDQAP